MLHHIRRYTKKVFRLSEVCHNRKDLVNYMNLAPDAVDRFLLPFGVKRVIVMDTDTAPGGARFLEYYDADNDPTKVGDVAELGAPSPRRRRGVDAATA